MIKVLIINYGSKPLPDVNGGGVESLIQMYLDQNFHRYSISVVSYFNAYAKEKSKKYKGIQFFYIKKTRIFKFFQCVRYLINKYSKRYIGNEFIYRCRKKINFNDYDLIISENGIDFGRYIKKYYNGKVVLHLHNDYLNVNTKGIDNILDGYDEIWALSEFVKNRIMEVNKNTIVKVLYNGVDLNLFKKKIYGYDDEKIRKKYGINNKDKVFIYCGRIVEEKGVYELVKAFINLVKNNTNVKLLIIGDYDIKDEYFNKIKEIANNQVVFTGYIEHKELPKLLNIGFCGIAPTVHLEKNFANDRYLGVIEGFNLTVIEYLGMGIPVIISNSGGMPELIDEHCGLIVSAKEKNIIEDLECAMNRMIIERNRFFENLLIERANMFSKNKYVSTFNEYIGDIYGKNK